MERLRAEDAWEGFMFLVVDEVESFSVSRIRAGSEKLVRAMDNARVLPFKYRQIQRKLKELVEDLSRPLGPLSSFNPHKIMFRRRLRQRFNMIRQEMLDIPDIRGTVSRIQASPNPSLLEGVQAQIYGRDHDKEKIVEFLCSQAQPRASHILSIYPILGMSGIGKTTLAQLAYNHQRVSTHFDVRIWISFSANFSVKKILCSIIDSVAQEKYDHYDLDVVERKVRDLLQWKRYLLVLDDLHLVYGELNELKSMLTRGSKGSCILVTTRDEEVAQVMGTFGPHHMTALSDDDCWSVCKQYAYRPSEQEAESFQRIGKEIVKKCEGLPLAAQALGVLMRSINKNHEWLKVVLNWSWHSTPELGNYALTSLSLRYSNLTLRSRLCFTFCAIFPPNTEIMKDDLIHLWMANGFISSDGNLEVEQVGDMIWNELYHKLFFTDVKTDDYSGHISFKMLGPVQEFVESTKSGDCVILDNYNKTSLSATTLHVGFGSDLLLFSKGTLQRAENLQTLYQFEFAFHNTTSGCFLTNCYLRVLRTSYLELSSLRNLIRLRYLELYGFQIKSLPDSIYSLKKLETLKLTSCRKLMCLPKYLTRLQNLRHLVISECPSLSRMCPNMHKLSCLRTLSLFIVSSKKGHKLEELGGLNLGEKLCIEGLKYVGSLSEAEGANLMGKTKLHELSLSWDSCGEPKSNATMNAEEVLEALQSPPNLKTLRICDYEGSRMPSWIQKLESLVALELFDCKMCLQLPQLGKLPFLKKLEIFSMDDVQYMDDDESCHGVEECFPSLEQLDVRGLPNLKQLLKVEREKMFPLLSIVNINDCSKLQLPSLPSVKELNIRRCNHKLLGSISSFNSLAFLNLSGGEDLSSLPEGMLRNLACLKTMILYDFPKLKVLPDELLKLNALERLEIKWCGDLMSLPEQEGWSGLLSLRYLEIAYCGRFTSLPEGVRQVTSLEVLKIECCPDLEKRCKKGTGEDWNKIAHIPQVILLQ